MACPRPVCAGDTPARRWADEVGLGKTIEAGLILREPLVSGKATTALLLVPASVIGQWQEELAEKFSLQVPRLEHGAFLDVDDQPVAWPGGNPWRAFPVMLASSHLARRRDRRAELLAAGPWDVVLVDEAHHARRSGSKPTDTPNRLLGLLQAMQASHAWRALYLASATPMQMHAHEAWDLLDLLGLTGRWAHSATGFLRYYTELREPFGARQWEFLRRVSADYFADPAAIVDPVLEGKVKAELGLAGSKAIRQFATVGLSRASAEELSPAARVWMDEWLRQHSPMRDRFVPMIGAEERLYRRIETYISRVLQRLPVRPGSPTTAGVHHDRLPAPAHLIVSGHRAEPSPTPRRPGRAGQRQ